MDPRNSLMNGFPLWLEEMASGPRVSQQAPLDPFATSARNCGRAAPWLTEIAGKETLSASDPRQALTDLQKMELVKRDGTTVELTQLGHRVLQGWDDLGVNSDDMDTYPTHEIIRSSVLVTAALSLGVSRYLDQYRFWCDMVKFQPAEDWFAGAVWDMYIPSYLNGTDERGYNPYLVLRALGQSVGGLEHWQAWVEDPQAPVLLEKFIGRVQGNRPGGRKNFMKAMEAYRIQSHEPARLAAALSTWGI